MKITGGLQGGTPPEKNWKNRRSQKLDKMALLELQNNLQSEIQAKQDISQELSKVRAIAYLYLTTACIYAPILQF